MSRAPFVSPLRAMTADDVSDVLDVQEPGAVLGLSGVFPQDAFPFPRERVTQRWLAEIDTPGIDCFVVLLDEAVVGFVAVRREGISAFRHRR